VAGGPRVPGGIGAVRVEAERPLLERPAIIAAADHEVDLLNRVLSYVSGVEIACRRIERRAERIAEPEGEDLVT
jgi:hypothetical protein